MAANKGMLLLSAIVLGDRIFQLGLTSVYADSEKIVESEDKAKSISLNIFASVDLQPHFVMFYAPWCGHCKRLHPIWESLAEKYNKEGAVTIGKVDCTQHKDLCASQKVNGYPTLKYYEGEKEGVKFKGQRDIESLEKFLYDQIHEGFDKEGENDGIDNSLPSPINGLLELTDDTFKETLSKGSHFVKFYAPWCVHCQKLAPTWLELAKTFEHDRSVTISKLDCTKYKTFCTEYDVKGYPTLLWIDDGVKVNYF